MDEDFEVLEQIEYRKERKNLRSILNKSKMDKFELDKYMGWD